MAVEYRLSQHALRNLRSIYRYSCDTWGEAQADIYLKHLYAALSGLVEHPDRDNSRQQRSQPFRMIACQKHFVVYNIIGADVLILAIMHQSVDVERHIANLTPDFRIAMASLKP